MRAPDHRLCLWVNGAGLTSVNAARPGAAHALSEMEPHAILQKARQEGSHDWI